MDKSNLIFDLHTHSCFSDGVLTPAELMQYASDQGVDVLSLTDHDNVSGVGEAIQYEEKFNISVVPGVEISSLWKGKTIHVIGLGVDTKNHPLQEGMQFIRRLRKERAIKIDRGLSKAGVSGALAEIAKTIDLECATRTHFARFLVASGLAKDMRTAFNRYLKKGKLGYVNAAWPAIEEAVTWIKGAGGVAVIAHPGRYKMTSTKMQEFLQEFKRMGGEGIEVITGRSDAQEVNHFSNLSEVFGFYASQGSDFHEPTPHGAKLGVLLKMPSHLKPVWEHPSVMKYIENT